jgi:hypothetical protein
MSRIRSIDMLLIFDSIPKLFSKFRLLPYQMLFHYIFIGNQGDSEFFRRWIQSVKGKDLVITRTGHNALHQTFLFISFLHTLQKLTTKKFNILKVAQHQHLLGTASCYK